MRADRPFSGSHTGRARRPVPAVFTPDGKGSVGGDFFFSDRSGTIPSSFPGGDSRVMPDRECIVAFPFSTAVCGRADGRRVPFGGRGVRAFLQTKGGGAFFGSAGRRLLYGAITTLRRGGPSLFLGASRCGEGREPKRRRRSPAGTRTDFGRRRSVRSLAGLLPVRQGAVSAYPILS